MRPRFAFFAILVQILFIAGHGAFYFTWIYFWRPGAHAAAVLGAVVAVLSLSFILASLLAIRFPQRWVRVVYTLAAAWLGAATYFFLAACACWMMWAVLRLGAWPVPGRALAATLYGLALLISFYGIANAACTRVRRVTVVLEDLPATWHGACLALVSDLHLGHVRNGGFARRLVALINRHRPQAVLIAGDLFDGTACDLDRAAGPWSAIAAPHGAFYIAGNHESFGRRAPYLAAAARAGLRVLDNERVVIAGLQLVGVHFAEADNPGRLRAILHEVHLNPATASILLTHAPSHLSIAEQAGVSLLLAGHTHGGQFFPVTHIVRRIYGRFAHGLQRCGALQVFISYGAGTWGPPLRIGTTPEVVLLRLVPAN